MAPVARLLAAAALVAAAPLAIHAQVRGLPVFNQGVSTGGVAALDIGFANEAAGDGTTIGASATAGMGPVAVTAGISVGTVADHTVWSPGVNVGVRVLGGGLVPFGVSLHAGVAQWSRGIVTTTHIPLALGLSGGIPIPGFTIRPWLAPRLDYLSTTFENSETSATEFAMSGGIEVALLNGFTIRTAYDRVFVEGDPGVLSVGVGMRVGR